MKTIILIAVFFLSIFSGVKAQKLWSLEECVNYALENNLQLKRQTLMVAGGRNNYTQSMVNLLPDLNGAVNGSYSSGKTIDYSKFEYVDQNYWSGSMGLQSSMTLFSGLQNVNNIKYNRYVFLKDQADLEKAKNDVSLQVALYYLQVLFALELEEVAAGRLEVTSLQADRMQKLLDAGTIAQGEYYQTRAQQANDRTALVNAGNNLVMAYLDLTQMLDLDSAAGFEIEIPVNIDVELVIPPEPVSVVYEAALSSMPQIRSAEYSLLSSRSQLAMAWGSISPSLRFTGSLSTRYSELAVNSLEPERKYEFMDQVNDYYYKQVSFGLTIPVFNRLQVKNSISNARLMVNDAEIQMQMVRDALYKTVQQAHADAVAAMQKYSASLEAVRYNEEAYKYSRSQFELGLMNTVDFTSAQNSYSAARSDMLQAKYEYIFKLKILDFYMNRPLTL